MTSRSVLLAAAAAVLALALTPATAQDDSAPAAEDEAETDAGPDAAADGDGGDAATAESPADDETFERPVAPPAIDFPARAEALAGGWSGALAEVGNGERDVAIDARVSGAGAFLVSDVVGDPEGAAPSFGVELEQPISDRLLRSFRFAGGEVDVMVLMLEGHEATETGWRATWRAQERVDGGLVDMRRTEILDGDRYERLDETRADPDGEYVVRARLVLDREPAQGG